MSASQTVDDIISKNISARGGAQKLADIQTLKIVGKIQTEGVEFPLVYIRKYPDKTRFQVDLNGQNAVTVFKQNTGWMIDPSRKIFKPTVLTAGELQQIKPMIDYFFVFVDQTLINYKADSLKPVLAGTDTVENNPAIKLKVLLKDNTEITYFYDTKTFFDVKHEVKFKYMAEPFTVSLKEFFTIHDLNVPRIIDSRQGNKRTTRMIIESVQIDNDIEDEIFEME